MSTLPSFSSVPGMAVPGNIQPGRDGQPSPLGAYQYLGQEACFYLDYLDLGTGRVLSPVPGNFYNMAVASGRAAFLTVPPPGRPWNPGNPGAGGTFAPLALRAGVAPQDYAAAMTQARAHNAARLAVLAREPGRPQPQGSPDYARTPAPPPPSVGATALAAGRAHNAARLAALARGEQAGGR